MQTVCFAQAPLSLNVTPALTLLTSHWISLVRAVMGDALVALVLQMQSASSVIRTLSYPMMASVSVDCSSHMERQ